MTHATTDTPTAAAAAPQQPPALPAVLQQALAQAQAYTAVAELSFDKTYYRRAIGDKGIRRLAQ